MDTPPDVQAITQKEKITILLSEYNTLRTEIIQRTGHGFQLLSVGVAISVWLGSMGVEGWTWFTFVAALAVFFSAISITLLGIRKLSARVRELEAEINSRAGETLLRWETKTGIQAKKYVVPELGH